MLRAGSPETIPESKTGPRAPARAGGAADGAAAESGPAAAGIARPIGVPTGGNWKIFSSASTFASARSIVTRAFRGPPFLPDSLENGNQTHATCS